MSTNTSLQPLGAAKVLVGFDIDAMGLSHVTEAFINGELVDAGCFHAGVIYGWEHEINNELRDEAEMRGEKWAK